MKSKMPDTDAWIRDNFEMIVEKYGGKYPYILVAGGRVFPVKASQNISKLEMNLRKRYSQKIIGMPVPKPQDFHSILFLLRLKA